MPLNKINATDAKRHALLIPNVVGAKVQKERSLTIDASKIDGTVWKTERFEFPGGGGAFQATMSFQGGVCENIHAEYASVTDDKSLLTSRRVTSYLASDEADGSSISFEHTAADSFVTIHSEERIKQFTDAAPGDTPWQSGVERKVTGTKVGGHEYSREGTQFKDTLKVGENWIESSFYPGLKYMRS